MSFSFTCRRKLFYKRSAIFLCSVHTSFWNKNAAKKVFVIKASWPLRNNIFNIRVFAINKTFLEKFSCVNYFSVLLWKKCLKYDICDCVVISEYVLYVSRCDNNHWHIKDRRNKLRLVKIWDKIYEFVLLLVDISGQITEDNVRHRRDILQSFRENLRTFSVMCSTSICLLQKTLPHFALNFCDIFFLYKLQSDSLANFYLYIYSSFYMEFILIFWFEWVLYIYNLISLIIKIFNITKRLTEIFFK